MIRIPLSDFLEIYLSAFLITIWLAWITANWMRRRRDVRSYRRVVECSICHFTYAATSGEHLPRCPNCGRLNERRPYTSL